MAIAMPESCTRNPVRSQGGRRPIAHVFGYKGASCDEWIGLDRDAFHLGSGAHVRCVGKGRKERTTPLTTLARRALTELGSAGRLSSSVEVDVNAKRVESKNGQNWQVGTAIILPDASCV